ncbi:MAG: GxxExxY protein [Bacteroidetes bacterium]|nr:GxxExxY protein [Bacteroidota bacterium]
MEVHRNLGHGFLEIVYKDAIEREFKMSGINFEREKKYDVTYKGIILPHYFFSDFVIENSVILEIKAQNGISNEDLKQTINYLAVSKCKIGLIMNFGEYSLKFKRIIL